MKIVHVTSYQVPGFGYEEIYLARAQRALGHEVTIVTSNYLYPPGIYQVLSRTFPQRQIAPCEEEVDGVRIVRLSSRDVGSRVWLHGLERRINQIDPDVVHCHNVLQFHTARLALMKAFGRSRFALVVDDHMQTSVMRRSMAGKLFYLAYGILAQPLIGRFVAHYSAKNDNAKGYMQRNCRIRAPIEVMTLGVDTERFVASDSARSAWRSRNGIPADAIVFLYTGKIIPAKGPHLLVAAATKLLAGGTTVHVALVGAAETEYLHAIRQRVIAAGLEEYFHFLPSVPHSELPSAYAAADACVWPRQESMAIFEALSTSLPVVVNSLSGYAPLVERGAGLVFNPDDESSLAQSMLVLAQSSKRQEMGAIGRDIVTASFSWRQSAERYLAAYQRSVRVTATSS